MWVAQSYRSWLVSFQCQVRWYRCATEEMRISPRRALRIALRTARRQLVSSGGGASEQKLRERISYLGTWNANYWTSCKQYLPKTERGSLRGTDSHFPSFHSFPRSMRDAPIDVIVPCWFPRKCTGLHICDPTYTTFYSGQWQYIHHRLLLARAQN